MSSTLANSNTLAHAVKGIATLKLTARPYNMHEPDNTIWWLVPSTDWPAYKYGKLFFDSRDKTVEEGNIFCGFYIEKGIDQSLSTIYERQPSLVMDSEWSWQKFIGEFQEGNLDEVVSNATKKSKHDVFIKIKANFITPAMLGDTPLSPEEFYKQKDMLPTDILLFKCHSGSLEMQNSDLKNFNKEQKNYYLHQASLSADFRSLAKNIQRVNDIEWFWVDFYIGIFLEKEVEGLSPEGLWGKFLSLWQPLLKKSLHPPLRRSSARGRPEGFKIVL